MKKDRELTSEYIDEVFSKTQKAFDDLRKAFDELKLNDQTRQGK